MRQDTTRRALFAAAPAIALAATPGAAQITSTTPLMALLAERNRLADWINNESDWGFARETEREAIHTRIFAMEDRIWAAAPTPDAIQAKLGLFLKLDAEGAEVVHDVMVPIIRSTLALLEAR